MENPCVICCSPVPNASTSSWNPQSSNEFPKICKEFYLSVLKSTGNKQRKGKKAVNLALELIEKKMKSNDFESFTNWWACSNCTTAIARAAVTGSKVLEVEGKVREMQRRLLQELKFLQNQIGQLSEEVTDIEGVILGSDKALLKQRRDVLSFREMVLSAAKEFQSRQEALAGKLLLGSQLPRRKSQRWKTISKSGGLEPKKQSNFMEMEFKDEPNTEAVKTEPVEFDPLQQFLSESGDSEVVVDWVLPPAEDYFEEGEVCNDSTTSRDVPSNPTRLITEQELPQEEDDENYENLNVNDSDDDYQPSSISDSEEEEEDPIENNDDDPSDSDFEVAPPTPEKRQKRKYAKKKDRPPVSPPPRKRAKRGSNPNYKRGNRGRNRNRLLKIDFTGMSPFKKQIVTSITRIGRDSWGADDPRILNPMEYDNSTGCISVGSFKNIMVNEEEKSMDCPECEFRAMIPENDLYIPVNEMFSHVLGKHLNCLNCPKCFKSYASVSTYKAHVRSHLNDEINKCDICGKPLNNKFAVRLHKWTHLNEEDQLETRKLLEKGELVTATGEPLPLPPRPGKHNEPMIPCPTCGKEFKKSKIWEHELIHTDQGASIYVCTKCGKKMTKGSLRYHKKYVCREEAEDGYVPPRVECPHCVLGPGKKTFKNRTMLRMHITRTHPEIGWLDGRKSHVKIKQEMITKMEIN